MENPRIYSKPEVEEILRQYTDRGWQMVLCKGYHPAYNAQRVYSTGKQPQANGWPNLRPTLAEGIAWWALGGWIGVRVPAGIVALDIDTDEGRTWVQANLKKEWTVSQTKNGYHLLFKAPEVEISGSTHSVQAGFKVTFRAAGKNQILVAPTPDRQWLGPIADEPPELPEALRPIPRVGEQAALQRMLQQIRELFDGPAGEKHACRVKGGRLLGGIIAGGSVEEGGEVVRGLIEFARSHSADPGRAEKDVLDGIEYGKQAPIRDLGQWLGLTRPEGRDVIEGPHKDRSHVDCAVELVRRLVDEYGFFRQGETLYWPRGVEVTPISTPSDPAWRGVVQGWRWWDPKVGFKRALAGGVAEVAWSLAGKYLPDRQYVGNPGIYAGQLVTKSNDKVFVTCRADLPGCSPQDSADWIMREILSDFAFESKDDYLKALAEIFTAFLWGQFSGPAPLFLHHASTSGAGKSLLAQAIGAIADGGLEPIRLDRMDDESEIGKRIFGILASKRKYAYIDNQKAEIGGQLLEALATSRAYSDRALYTQKMFVATNETIWTITGNNVGYSPDMARRIVEIRIDNHGAVRDPASFRHVPLVPWVQLHHAEIAGHVCNVLQGWAAAGCPLGEQFPGSFEGWARTLSGVIGWLFGSCPRLIDAQSAAAEHDPRFQAWCQITAEWKAGGDWERRLTVQQIADLLRDSPWSDVVRVREGDLRSSVRWALQKAQGQIYDGLRVCREYDPHKKQYLYYLQIAPDK